ncbi:UV-stimulated scaffold protein A [Dillenia turbinata]|uniref:UV-stimulated scaffold protein A n=1 Tax=Dillenia turbinata TaxID=194707 RepID=A0AAN8W2N0_9MAGN
MKLLKAAQIKNKNKKTRMSEEGVNDSKLNVHTIVYKDECNEIQPYRTPLSRGGLCQSRDLKICPFRGPIIPRDKGKPVNVSLTQDKKVLDLGADLVEELARKVVKNVRERGKEEAREHNEAVLRGAAIASTSRSMTIGDLDATSTALPMSKSKKQGMQQPDSLLLEKMKIT